MENHWCFFNVHLIIEVFFNAQKSHFRYFFFFKLNTLFVFLDILFTAYFFLPSYRNRQWCATVTFFCVLAWSEHNQNGLHQPNFGLFLMYLSRKQLQGLESLKKYPKQCRPKTHTYIYWLNINIYNICIIKLSFKSLYNIICYAS